MALVDGLAFFIPVRRKTLDAVHERVIHLSLSAGKRLSAKAYLEQWGPKLFPGYFSTFLHPFFTALRPMDADERVAAVLAAYPQLLLAMQPRQSSSPERSLGVACTSATLGKGCNFG